MCKGGGGGECVRVDGWGWGWGCANKSGVGGVIIIVCGWVGGGR